MNTQTKAMLTSNIKMPLSENHTQRCLPLSHDSLAYWVTLFQIVHSYIIVDRGPTIRGMCHLPFERKELENCQHWFPKTFPQVMPGDAGLLSQIMGRWRQEDHTFQACLNYKTSSRPGEATKQGTISKSKAEKGGQMMHFSGKHTPSTQGMRKQNMTRHSPWKWYVLFHWWVWTPAVLSTQKTGQSVPVKRSNHAH